MSGSRGLLAADESNKSAMKRFEALNIPCNEQTRRDYREMLLTTPHISQYITGVIFYDETIRQSTRDGMPFTKLLEENGILPGIKVDKGLVDLTNFENETVTEGLDGLGQRFAEYHQMGARFAKWRAAFQISASSPSQAAIHANATMFARYSALAQAAGIVPIVEPEVLYDGNHSIEQSEETIKKVLSITLEVLKAYKVDLSGLIVKTSMVLPGKESGAPHDAQAVASRTVAVLKEAVPAEVAGVVFLSGGQTPQQATENLAAICKFSELPWPLTFSYSRAVQDPAMKLWLGRDENIRAAQDAFALRLKLNSAARSGTYDLSQES